MPELIYDPFDPATRRDPYPVYARLREEAPLYRSALGPIVVSRYDDVHEILKNVEDFSSSPFGDLVVNVDRMIVEEGVAEAAKADKRIDKSRARQKNGKRMFEAAEIRAIIRPASSIE